MEKTSPLKPFASDSAFQEEQPYTVAAAPDSYETQLYNWRVTTGRVFLKDRTVSDVNLPKLLPKGIPYAANFISFNKLNDDGVLMGGPGEEVSITANELRILYQAKCIDQDLVPSWEREVRFMELVSANCKGNFFCLPENGFGVYSADAITHVLSSNRRYSILDLSGNRLRDEGAQSLAQLLSVNKTLVHIGLSSNDIGHTGGMALAKSLENNNTVVSLDLGAKSGVNGNHIGTKGAEALGKLLEKNQVLSKLNLSSNGLGAKGLEFIAMGLVNNCTLTHFDISNNNLGSDGAAIVAKIIGYGTVTHLTIKRNAFGDKGGRTIFEAIQDTIDNEQEMLQVLDMENNELDSHTARAIQKVLSSSNTLKQLNVSGNHLGSSAKYIAQGLNENKHLTHLYICECDVRETEGPFFGAALSSNYTLQVLDLSRNKLKDAGAKEIAKGMTANRGLIALNLSGNKISDQGGEALAGFLLVNKSLQNLNLRRNAMSSATGEMFNDNLRSNNTIESMDVTYNDFSYKCFIGITNTLARNATANKQLKVPKLNAEIEALAPKEKELSQVQEEIDMEKRIIRDRSEQLLRKSEEARVMAEKMRRDIADLEKVLEKIRNQCETAEDIFRRTEDKVTNEIATLKMKKGNVDNRIQQEKDKVERMQRDMERMRRQIKNIEDAENEQFASLNNELQDTDTDRNREMNDAKYEAEKLAGLELKKKELEIMKASKKKKTTRPWFVQEKRIYRLLALGLNRKNSSSVTINVPMPLVIQKRQDLDITSFTGCKRPRSPFSPMIIDTLKYVWKTSDSLPPLLLTECLYYLLEGNKENDTISILIMFALAERVMSQIPRTSSSLVNLTLVQASESIPFFFAFYCLAFKWSFDFEATSDYVADLLPLSLSDRSQLLKQSIDYELQFLRLLDYNCHVAKDDILRTEVIHFVGASFLLFVYCAEWRIMGPWSINYSLILFLFHFLFIESEAAMAKHFDIFGNELPSWIQHLAPKNCCTTLRCLSLAQSLHIGLPASTNHRILFTNLQAPLDWCQSCCTQCRSYIYVHETKGERCGINHNFSFLNTKGSSLTYDSKSLDLLHATSYSSPFWVSQKDLVALSLFLPALFHLDDAEKVFQHPELVLRIVDSSKQNIDVINLEELQHCSSLSLSTAFSLFRPFTPFNIRTKQPFLPSTEMLIRCECWKTRSWCSIWGTPEDFLSVGVQPLEGAISLTSFDRDGNELALTNALRTANAVRALCLFFSLLLSFGRTNINNSSTFGSKGPIISRITGHALPIIGVRLVAFGVFFSFALIEISLMTASSDVVDEPLRQKLLVQLSALRRYFFSIVRASASVEGNEEEDAAFHESVLDQSARDAIEAFFNADDDFTRQFNEGTGNIKRADLLSLDLFFWSKIVLLILVGPSHSTHVSF
eukprot:gene2360-1487_t